MPRINRNPAQAITEAEWSVIRTTLKDPRLVAVVDKLRERKNLPQLESDITVRETPNCVAEKINDILRVNDVRFRLVRIGTVRWPQTRGNRRLALARWPATTQFKLRLEPRYEHAS